MSSYKIHYFKQKIINTEAFKKLNKTQKSFCKMRNNVKRIEESLKNIKKLGFARWEETTQTSYTNLLIIKELNEEFEAKNTDTKSKNNRKPKTA